MPIPNNLVFATGNLHKLSEITAMLSDHGIFDLFKMETLRDIGCEEDIPETADTIEGNAIIKAKYVFEHYGRACFAEDTGLIVPALNGEPGIYSARYAGPQRDAIDNMDLLLKKLADHADRSAYFETVIALVTGEETTCFAGRAPGKIIFEKRGSHGFGYDPIFVPESYNQTFAELKSEIKNKISHRHHAMIAFINYLRDQIQ